MNLENKSSDEEIAQAQALKRLEIMDKRLGIMGACRDECMKCFKTGKQDMWQ